MPRWTMPYDPKANGARCDVCPLAGKKVVPPEGDAAIVIVADSPGRQDEQLGKLYSGSPGFKLNDLLRRAGLPGRNGIRVTAAILCRPEVPDEQGKKRFDLKAYLAWMRKQNVRLKKAGQPLLVNPFDCCRPRLMSELKRAEFLAKLAHKSDPSQFPSGAVVFPTGNFGLAELMGVQKRAMKVMNYRGSVMTPEALELREAAERREP